jgi:uncharacterized protein (DUF1810 family)
MATTDTGTSDDPHDLDRFVYAQGENYERALAEIRNGQKRSHWMWYIFPQLAGLGSSSMARRYAIKTVAEAEAYLGHPILGPRLRQCMEATLQFQGRSALAIFGSTDEVKLRSCATLFAQVSPAGSVFALILDKYFHGGRDSRTLELLGVAPAAQ